MTVIQLMSHYICFGRRIATPTRIRGYRGYAMICAEKEPGMAGRSTQGTAGPETLEKESAGYDSDFYAWSQEQGRLVREGRWSEVDRENVAEEIESLGREQFNKLESAIRVILIHILKWEHQASRQ